jgi:hypothetical protein
MDSTGTLRLVIQLMWGDEPFVLNSINTNVSNYRVKVEALKFYLGDMQLVNSTDSATLKDVDLFSLANGNAVAEYPAEAGTYSRFRAGLGVPRTLNDADPILYAPGHPLNLSNAMYWGWAMAYRFLLFDGRYDLDASGTGQPILPFSMHTGLNDVYRTMDLDLPSDLTIVANETTSLTLKLSVDRFFYSDSDTLDLLTENQTHGTNLPLAIELTENAVQSFSVE